MSSTPENVAPVTERRNKKRAIIVIATLLAASGVGSLAFAYWTTGGSGTGGATAGSTVNVSVKQTSANTGLYPGAAPQALSGNFNNTNSGPVHLTTVTASVTSVTGAGAGGCTAADFDVAGTGVVAGSSVPAGTAVGSWGGLTIQLKETGVNQDGCQGA